MIVVLVNCCRSKSSIHGLWVDPVEFSSSDWERSPNRLEYIIELLCKLFDLILVICLDLVNCCNDVLSICDLKTHIFKSLIKIELHIACLKVVVVNLDRAA